MSNLTLTEVREKLEDNNQLKSKKLPYFIVLYKNENKKIKIPCSNETVAMRILNSYTNNNSNCKISLM